MEENKTLENIIRNNKISIGKNRNYCRKLIRECENISHNKMKKKKILDLYDRVYSFMVYHTYMSDAMMNIPVLSNADMERLKKGFTQVENNGIHEKHRKPKLDDSQYYDYDLINDIVESLRG